MHNLCAEDIAMQKEIKIGKNKIPKITEEEYLQYVTALKNGEESTENRVANGQNTPSSKQEQ